MEIDKDITADISMFLEEQELAARQEGLQKWMSLFWSIFQGKNRKV